MKETSGLFVYHGSRHLVNFNASVSLIMSQQFCLAGLMITTSIVNGGPGFPLLPMCVYRYIVDWQIDVDVDADELCADVVNVEARGVLEKVCLKYGLCTSQEAVVQFAWLPEMSSRGLCGETRLNGAGSC